MKRLASSFLGVCLAVASACGGQVEEDPPPDDGFSGAPGTDGLPLDGVGGSAPASGGAPAVGGAPTGNSGGAALTGGSGGLADTGGTGGSDGWLVGDPCTEPGEVACAGPAQSLLVQCQDGMWREYGTCQSGQYCDTSTGQCAEPAPGCNSLAPNEIYCSWDQSIYQCGPDLVTRELVQVCDYCDGDHCICPPGTFGADGGMTTCEPCPPGTMSAEQDSASCVPWTACPGHLIAIPGTELVDQVCGEPFRDLGMLDAHGLAVTPADELVVAGVIEDRPGDYDALLQTQDDLGTMTSSIQFGTPETDLVLALAVDSAGGRYVAGSTTGELEGTTFGGADAFIRKYDAAGSSEWTRQFGGSAEDRIEAVAVHDAGSVYVAGTIDAFWVGEVTTGDVLLRKYDLDGNEAWTQIFGTQVSDFALGVAVAPGGNVYVAGSTYGDLSGASAGELDAFLRKYDPDGAVQWTRQVGGAGFDYGYAVAVDATEAVYFVVQDFVAPAYARKYAADGSEIWTRTIGVHPYDQVTEVALDAEGNVYFGSAAWNSLADGSYGSADVWVRKYTSSGDQVWIQRIDLGGSEQVHALAVGALGQVYVAGYSEVPMPSGGNAFVAEVWPP